MKLLAIDTATEACSVALQVGDAVIARFAVAGRAHTQMLPKQVAEVLAEAGVTVRDLDGVVCGIGPGSFAGLRIGLSYAKGLAMVGGLPMVGVSSLQMLAGPSTLDRVLTVIDARLSAVYAAPLAAAWGAALPVIDGTALPSAVHALPPGRDALLRGAGLDAAQLQPLYLRNKVALTQVEQQALRAPRQG